MADGSLAKSPIKWGSSSPAFGDPGMENSSNPQPSFPHTALSDFDRHHLQPAWQQNLEAQFSFSGDHGDNRRLLPTFISAGMDAYNNAQFHNMGAAWGNRGSYASNAIAGNLPSDMCHEHVNVGPVHVNTGLDYVNPGQLEHLNTGHAHMNAEASLRKMATLRQSSPEIDKLFNRSSWGVMDPLSENLTMQGISVATSHHLASLPTDPGFTDRAARFSAFGNMGYSDCHLDGEGGNGLSKAFQNKTTRHHHTQKQSEPSSPVGADINDVQECHRFSTKDGSATLPIENTNVGMDRRSSFPPMSGAAVQGTEGVPKQLNTSVHESDESMGQEVSSSCEKSNEASPIQGLTGNVGRKRKARRLKLNEGDTNKDHDPDGSNLKCQKRGDQDQKQSTSGNSEASTPKSAPESTKPPEPPKQDYIHVRARRGQATDSHSLAERVRREKISERMKFLQDLVPGCSKVTGKAVMLDEIINYVQSLQRQVEFLSMKLAAVNPRVDFSIDNLAQRERVQHRAPVFSLDNGNMYPPLHPHQQSHAPMQGTAQCPPFDAQSFGSDPALRRTLSTPPSMNTFGNAVSQVPQAWDDELQSVVQMSFAPGASGPPPVDLQGQMFSSQMKAEH